MQDGGGIVPDVVSKPRKVGALPISPHISLYLLISPVYLPHISRISPQVGELERVLLEQVLPLTLYLPYP